MSKSGLRTRQLASIGLTQASEELQEGFLYAYERIANRRMGWIVYDMFSNEQVEQVRRMRQSGVPDSDVLAWIKSQMRVSYDDLYETCLLTVVWEVETARARR